MTRWMTFTAALIMLTPPALAEPEVWLRLQTEAGPWSRDAIDFHLDCPIALSDSLGWTVPDNVSMSINLRLENTGTIDDEARFPCVDSFGEHGLCDDFITRYVDIRLTAEATRPVTLLNLRNGDSGQNAITLTRLRQRGWSGFTVTRSCTVGAESLPVLIRTEITEEWDVDISKSWSD